jgi:hypothetical protein
MTCRFAASGVYSVVRLPPTPVRLSWIPFAIVLACAALLSAASAQNAAPQKFTVSGTVVNSASGEGIARALVRLSGSPERTAFSDSNGAFVMEGVPAGRFAISAEKPGFFGREAGSRPQVIELGPSADNVAIRLAPESVIYGRLLDSNDQPIEGISVHLLRMTVRNGKTRWESRGLNNSDEDGAFRFANLQPGTYYLSAGPQAIRVNPGFVNPEKPRTGWPGLYYPGVPDLSAAASIRITAGQQIQADFTMNKVPLYSVAGVVSGLPPKQGVSLLVQTPSGDNLPVATQFSSDTGAFDLRLPEGSYRLRAMSQSGEQQLRADLRISVNNDLTQLHLALQPAVIIPIHARLENRAQDSGQRTSRSTVTRGSDPEIPPVNVQLVSAEPSGNDAYAIVQGNRGNRMLVLQGVEPGRYSAVLSAHSGWYVESATCGNTNLLSEDLVIAGGGGCSMELLLRNDSGMVSVSVKASQPGVSGTAILVPARGRALPQALPFTTASARSPETSASISVAPGEYLVYAFDSSNTIEYSNPEALRPYTSQATAVTVSPGETAKVTANLISTGADAP